MPSKITASNIADYIHVIHDTQHEFDVVENALSKIYNDGQGAGATLLSKITSNCSGARGVFINLCSESFTIPVLTGPQLEEYGVEHNIPNDPTTDRHNKAAKTLSEKDANGNPGEGTHAVIAWRPEDYIDVSTRGRSYERDNSNYGFISLAHELVHAYRKVKGNATGSTICEEKRAVGLGQFSGSSFSENAIRREHGLPIRNRYQTLEDPDCDESPESGSDYY